MTENSARSMQRWNGPRSISLMQQAMKDLMDLELGTWRVQICIQGRLCQLMHVSGVFVHLLGRTESAYHRWVTVTRPWQETMTIS